VASTLPVKHDDFETRFTALFDMSWADLQDRVLLRAQAVARSYDTKLYPNGASGTVRYLHLVAHLSEVLLPLGWERCDDDNIPRLVDRERKVALVVASGDALTGTPWSFQGRYPRSKYPKGEATKKAVDRNVQRELTLFDDEPDAQAVELSDYETWFLMVYVSTKLIQAEVSRPQAMDDKGYVCVFEPRILMPSLPNDGTAIDITDDESVHDADSNTGGIDIPIGPRS
jgi:hypothetical protein